MATIGSKAQAELELALMQAESETMLNSDLYIWLRECGLPPEVAIRLRELVQVTQRIGSKLVSIGKLIVIKVREFIMAHKNLAVGTLWAVAISSLVAGIPLFGSLLAPIGALFGLVVIVSGHQSDKYSVENRRGLSLLEMPQNLIEIAGAFFDLFIDTFRIVMDELSSEKFR